MSPHQTGAESARIAKAERFDRVARWVAFTVFLLLALAITTSLHAQSCGDTGQRACESATVPAGTVVVGSRNTWSGARPCWSGAPGCRPPAGKAGAYVAEVRCEAGVPVPHYADDTASVHGITRAETVKHETMHVAQLIGGCDSILALWSRDTLARVEAEIDATCAGLEVYAHDPERRASREREAMVALGLLYGSAVNFGDLYQAFVRSCRGQR